MKEETRASLQVGLRFAVRMAILAALMIAVGLVGAMLDR